MQKRILVPLDGSAPVEAGVLYIQNRANLPTRTSFLSPLLQKSQASFLFRIRRSLPALWMKGKRRLYPSAISNRVEGEGIKTSLFMRKGPLAEAILAVADVTTVDTIRNPHMALFKRTQQLIVSMADQLCHLSGSPAPP